MEALLAITDLHADVGGKEILAGISLAVKPGQIHMIMGPNGSGKSTLAHALAGHPRVRVSGGSMTFAGEDILMLPPEERARRGLHLWPQASPEIAGVGMVPFLRSAASARGNAVGHEGALREAIAKQAERAGMSASLLERNLNEGFSGGEKKRSELLQMIFFRPRLAILDECDSGLDVDGIRAASAVLGEMRREGTALIVITHSSALREHISPDAMHVLVKGKIAQSGGVELAAMIEQEGFASFGA